MDERLLGLYALISPGADTMRHTLTMELQRSTLVRFAANDEVTAIAEILRWFDMGTINLIELGGGWTHSGVARLADIVGERSLVTARWFPDGEMPIRRSGKIHRANVFFCSTKDVRAFLDTPRDAIWFVGINNPEHGVETCERLVKEEGVQVIEICSDWGFDGAAKVQEAVGEEVKVGVSLHQALDAERRAAMLYVPPPFARNDTAVERRTNR